jgi:hypothetical protein
MTTRKLTDTPLNLWIKNLSMDEKKRFFKAYYTNPIMFMPDVDDDLKRRRMNNYRYKGHIKGPGHAEKIAIYISAVTVDESLKLQDIFPEIPENWVKELVPTFFIISEILNNHANSSQLLNRLHAPAKHIDNHTCYQGGS